MKQLIDMITEEMEEAFEAAGYDRSYAKVTLSNRPDLCEYQCNGAMAGAKAYKKAPFMIAQDVVSQVRGGGSILSVEVVKPGFINIKLDDKYIAGYLNEMGQPQSVSDTYHYYHSLASHYVLEAGKGNDNEDIGEPSKTVRTSAGYSLEDKPEGKKEKPPVPKTAAKKVQFSFMDKEAKAYKKMAKAKAKGEEIKGAAKAVGAIPLKIKDNIDESIKKWDAMDDERRRKYIVKPGFRKKAFRNLKLAMLYGASASYSVLMIPITMIARHYSKQKDRRIRNQLAHELANEIEVCKEKIQDAASNGDNKEKYKLMRIKSKLELERQRVFVVSCFFMGESPTHGIRHLGYRRDGSRQQSKNQCQ